MSAQHVPIFDGHNDVLLRLYRRGGPDAAAAFLRGESQGHLDLRKARRGGFAGGLFAIFVPSPGRKAASPPSIDVHCAQTLSPPAIDVTQAQQTVFAMTSLLFRIERESRGHVRICRTVGDIESCI